MFLSSLSSSESVHEAVPGPNLGGHFEARVKRAGDANNPSRSVF